MDGMMSRIAYIKGLMEGMKVDSSTSEGRIIVEMMDVMKDMAEELVMLKDSVGDMEEYVDSIDEDLGDLEEILYDDEDDDDEFEDYYDDDDSFIEVKCTNCGEAVYIDGEIMKREDSIMCPSCHKSIELKKGCQCNCNCNDRELND